MYAYELQNLLSNHNWQNHRYLEFINVPSLSMGIYRLPVEGIDGQQPHTEDEIYYVISGRAKFQLENETRMVSPGSILYVAAHQTHKFYEINEELTLLVFFAPAEYS